MSDSSTGFTHRVANHLSYNNGAAGWASGATRAGGCTPSTFCQLSFQNDGNLVVYAGTTAIWNSQTGGRGAAIQIQNVQPYIFMINGQGTIIWSSGGPTRPGYNPCDNGCCRNGLYVC